MRKLLLLLIICCIFSSCYTVTRVGNCKYYTPKKLGSRDKLHHPIYF
jgi:hypothetical protein